jgi:hypothetical protein
MSIAVWELAIVLPLSLASEAKALSYELASVRALTSSLANRQFDWQLSVRLPIANAYQTYQAYHWGRIARKYGIRANRYTITNIFKEAGYRRYKANKKPLLNKDIKDRRLN